MAVADEDEDDLIPPVTVHFSADQLSALDAWIERQPDQPSRAEAVRHLLAGMLGTAAPSTVLPNMVTGRDID